jgi:hypothetical protein
MEMASPDPTVGGSRILAISMEKEVDMEVLERPETVMICEVGEEM